MHRIQPLSVVTLIPRELIFTLFTYKHVCQWTFLKCSLLLCICYDEVLTLFLRSKLSRCGSKIGSGKNGGGGEGAKTEIRYMFNRI